MVERAPRIASSSSGRIAAQMPRSSAPEGREPPTVARSHGDLAEDRARGLARSGRRRFQGRHAHLDLEVWCGRRVDDGHRAIASEEFRHALEGPRRGGQPDSLRILLGDDRQSFEAQRQVGSALRSGERVDLVHDDRVNGVKVLASLGAEQEEQRFRRRDEDLGRVLRLPPALFLRSVARTHVDSQGSIRFIGALREPSDPDERCAQVPLDVVGQRLQRRDVDDSDPGFVGGVARHPIDRREKRGEGLARTRRCDEQRVIAGPDGRPTALLNQRRVTELILEPVPSRRREMIHAVKVRQELFCGLGRSAIARTRAVRT